MTVKVRNNFNNILLDDSNAGNIESVWDNYPEIRPPNDTLLTQAALDFMETALNSQWWDLAEANLYKDRYEALGGGGVVTVPQYILDLFPAE